MSSKDPTTLLDDDMHNHHWPFIESTTPEQQTMSSLFGTLYKIPLLYKHEKDDEFLCSDPLTLHGTSLPILCWHRFKIWWMRPVFVNEVIPPEMLAVLYRCSDSSLFRFLIVAGDEHSSLRGVKTTNDDGNRGVQLVSTSKSAQLYCGVSKDPYALIREALQVVGWANQQADQHRRHSLSSSSMLNTLGWCTWNAFYTQINGERLVEAVKKVTQSTKVQWMILDDGWQHTTNDEAVKGQQWGERLESLNESPRKFNALSLKETVHQIKELGVSNVWVWHTLTGYWLGLDNKSFPNSRLYYPHFSPGILANDPSATREASVEKGISVSTHPYAFFDSYHGYLQDCGVSGVKVDAQGVVGTLRPNKEEPSNENSENLLAKLHDGLARSIQRHFQQSRGITPPVIHCMAHAPGVFRQLSALYPERPLLRASDDHYPDNVYSHAPHIVACAYNSLLFSHFSVPDWDMFTTSMGDDKLVRLHAVSRCISGGPVYISDPPTKIRKEVIDWICCKDGSTFPCYETAMPTTDCLLMDPLAADAKPLVLGNVNGSSKGVTSGMFGVFHLAGGGTWDYGKLDYRPSELQDEKSAIRKTVSLRPADIVQWADVASDSGRRFLAVPFTEPWSRAKVLDSASSAFEVELGRMECDAVAMVPIHRVGEHEIALLGMEGMINRVGAVLHTTVNKRSLMATVRGCGMLHAAIRFSGTDVNPRVSRSVSVAVGSSEVSSVSIRSGMFELEVDFDILFFDLKPSHREEQVVTFTFVT